MLLAAVSSFASVDLRNAAIQVRANASAIEKKAAQMIAEEIERRTQLRLPSWPRAAPGDPDRQGSGPPEDLLLLRRHRPSPSKVTTTVASSSAPGYLLRQLTWRASGSKCAEA